MKCKNCGCEIGFWFGKPKSVNIKGIRGHTVILTKDTPTHISKEKIGENIITFACEICPCGCKKAEPEVIK